MIQKLLDKLFDKKVILNCDHDPYLHRWYLFRSKKISVFLHKFIRSDEDRALHDHPWAFLVIPLWRGYSEHTERTPTRAEVMFGYASHYPNMKIPVKRRVFPLLGSRYRPNRFRHRVELISGKPAWSLFIHFERTREWGFWEGLKFIHWKQWWSDKCE